jgi:hypothetical protein
VDPAVPQPADVIVRSGDDLAPSRSDASIEEAIDQLIMQFAAFCIDQLEKSVASSGGVDLNGDADALEDEFQVRTHSEENIRKDSIDIHVV